MVGIWIRVFSNDQMVARLSTETNQKSPQTIGRTPNFMNPLLKRNLDSSLVRSNGGDGVRLTYISGRSLLITKVAVKSSKLDIVKHMAFEIVRLRFYKATLFSGNGFGNELHNAKEAH